MLKWYHTASHGCVAQTKTNESANTNTYHKWKSCLCKAIVACPFISLFSPLHSTMSYETHHGPIFTLFETLAQFKPSRLQNINVQNITEFYCCCCCCFASLCRSFGCVGTISCTCNSMRFTQCICYETCIQRSKTLKNSIQFNPFIVISVRLDSTYYAVYKQSIQYTRHSLWPFQRFLTWYCWLFFCVLFYFYFIHVQFHLLWLLFFESVCIRLINRLSVVCAQYVLYRWTARHPKHSPI